MLYYYYHFSFLCSVFIYQNRFQSNTYHGNRHEQNLKRSRLLKSILCLYGSVLVLNGSASVLHGQESVYISSTLNSRWWQMMHYCHNCYLFGIIIPHELLDIIRMVVLKVVNNPEFILTSTISRLCVVCEVQKHLTLSG